MTVTCPRDELTRALGIVSRGVSTRTTVQILAGILLRTAGGKLRARGNRHGAVAASVVDVAGATRARSSCRDGCCSTSRACSPPRRWRSSTARGSGRRGPFRIGDLPAAHLQRGGLPAAARGRSGRAARGRPRDGADTIARVSRSASRDESRPVLTGVLVRFEPGQLVMAATDSYRLSVKETAVEGTVPELEAIVPARALGELARIAQEGEKIELGVHENQVIFATGDALADHAPHRRPVPELQAAAAGGLRARAGPAARGAAGRRSPRRR